MFDWVLNTPLLIQIQNPSPKLHTLELDHLTEIYF